MPGSATKLDREGGPGREEMLPVPLRPSQKRPERVSGTLSEHHSEDAGPRGSWRDLNRRILEVAPDPGRAAGRGSALVDEEAMVARGWREVQPQPSRAAPRPPPYPEEARPRPRWVAPAAASCYMSRPPETREAVP